MPVLPRFPSCLHAALAEYRQRWPGEDAAPFEQLLEDTEHAFHRERLAGHFTASAWLVSVDGRSLLMTHHRKLGRWLQLGGHADGDVDLPRVALREAQEESGLTALAVDPRIFDLDRHWIPEHRDVPGHWHFDVRYVVRALRDERVVVSAESHALAWRDIAELSTAVDTDPSIARMAHKWLSGGFAEHGCGADRIY